MKKRLIFYILVSSLAYLGISNHNVMAQSSVNDYSGTNKSSDYQPLTRNPQAGVASGLQNTNNSLQPVSGQPSISQQNLGTVSNLQVAPSNTNASSNSTTPSIKTNPSYNHFWVYLLSFMAAASVVAFLIIKSRSNNTTEVVDQQPAPTAIDNNLAIKANKTKPKKSRKNKKSKKKR